MAILVRAIFQTREFEERFLKIGMPYRILGGTKFYERAEIKDCVAYLRLIHQKKDGWIELKIAHTEDSLILKVEDNGMGRKAASRLKNTNALEKNIHKSHATKILKERIDVLNYIYKTKSVFYLEDILENGTICGTRAVLVVPRIIAKK